jgi:hypothetical protein
MGVVRLFPIPTRRRYIIKSKKTGYLFAGAIVLFLAFMVWLGHTERLQWDNATREDNVETYRRYIDSFPRGEHVDEAKKQLGQLELLEKQRKILIDQLKSQLIFEEITNNLEPFRSPF